VIEVFEHFTTNLKIYMTLPIAGCEAEGNFSKLSTINNEFVYRK
jgi:hypothetical protein